MCGSLSTSPKESTGVTQASESANTLVQWSRSWAANASVNTPRSSGQRVTSFCAGKAAGSRPSPASMAA